MKFPFPAILFSLGIGGMAPAAVINFDFNDEDSATLASDTYEGLGAAPDSASNDHWNGVRRSSSSFVASNAPVNGPTEDSGGVTTTTVSVTIGNVAGGDIRKGRSAGDQEVGGAGLTFEDLMGDYLQLRTAGGVANALVSAEGFLENLAANQVYDIYFYAQGNDYDNGLTTTGQNSQFAITDGVNGNVVIPAKQTGWDGVIGGNGILTENVEYVKFTAQANGAGEIFFRWSNVVLDDPDTPLVNEGNAAFDSAPNGVNRGAHFAALNGIQIVAVPEPSVTLLGALGAFGLLARRRRA